MYILLFVALVVGAVGGGAYGMNRKELRKLAGARAGTTHAVQVRRGTVRLTVWQYGKAGWNPTSQARMHTPGNKHLVAMTFCKE